MKLLMMFVIVSFVIKILDLERNNNGEYKNKL